MPEGEVTVNYIAVHSLQTEAGCQGAFLWVPDMVTGRLLSNSELSRLWLRLWSALAEHILCVVYQLARPGPILCLRIQL